MHTNNTMKNPKHLFTLACSMALLWVLYTGPAAVQTITEIIDTTGDGAGNTLGAPRTIAVNKQNHTLLLGHFLTGNHNFFTGEIV